MYGALMLDIASHTLSENDKHLLAQPEVGGIILFGRNVATPTQVRQLCDAIRQVRSTQHAQIIIGVDQEGGRVARLRQGFSPLPAMGALGQRFDSHPEQGLALAYDCGYLMAAEVLAVGIDVSFAPVLDLNASSQVIGDRSFHSQLDPIVVLASAFIQGMQAAGMASTGKHFPGHGSVAPDSHLTEAIDSRPFAQIYAQDLQPFIRCLPYLDALMPAHVIFSAVDKKPAGFSKVWLQDIARNQLGFNGVLFSDDLSMQGAQSAGGVGKRVSAALSAGCDMALVCNDRPAALQAIASAKLLPPPNQSRLHRMRGQIPSWQGSLEATCMQFAYWQQAKQQVQQAFFDLSTSDTPLGIDPTHYS